MDDERTIRTLKILSILTVLFILYNTLMPFKPYSDWWKVARHLHRIELIPMIVRGRMNPLTDLIGNVLLFIPFGFFIMLYLLAQRRTGNGLKIVFAGMLFSLSIEITQIFFRYRTPSTTDVIMNTFGTAVGVIGAKIYFRHLAVRVQRFIETTLENEPVTLILILIILVQFFGSLLPFNVTITISDLKRALAHANIEPFGVKPLGLLFGTSHKYAAQMTFSGAKFLGNVLFYAIYGYLVLYSYFQYWRFRREGKWFLFALLILYFPLLEVTQFFIKSRTADINDVISGYSGAFIGAAALLAVRKKNWFRGMKTIEIKHFILPIFIYLLYIFYTGFRPFDFTTNYNLIRPNLQIHNLVPFYAYYKVTSLWNIYDLLESFFMLLPLGFVWALLKNKNGISQKAERQAVVIGLAVALIIEGAQVLLPSRTGEVTDVIMNAFGCYAGARFYRYYYQNYIMKNDFIRSLSKKDNV